MLVAVERGLAPGHAWPVGLLFLGVVVFAALAALGREHEGAWSATIVYLACGGLAAVGMSLLGVDPLDPFRDTLVVERLTEIALVVAVFAGGLAIERSIGARQWRQVVVLLLVAMPLAIAAIAVFGRFVMGLSTGAAILLGAVLAPTDPVLAGDLGVGPPGEMDDSPEPRFSLHTEATINDGLASPFVLLGLFAAARGGTGWLGEWALADVLYAVPVAVLVGALGGTLLARATHALQASGVFAGGREAFVALAASLMVYGAAEALDAYGLLAAFTAGFAFRRYEFEHAINRRVHDGADGVGRFLELAVLLLLGSLFTIDALGAPGVAGWLLAPLLIFVIRPATVLPLADRTIMTGRESLYLAWFGVRGVAALFYAAYVVHAHVLAAHEARVFFWTVAACIAVSIVVHGVTATPLSRRWLDPET